jgi:hypothetical protein
MVLHRGGFNVVAKMPAFHKFHDPSSQSLKALSLNDSQLAHYLSYIDSIFTISEITFNNDVISIRKYLCPKIRMSAALWSTHVFIVATIKKPYKLNHIAVYGPVMYYSNDKFDDKRFRIAIAKAVFETWGIDLRK